MGRGHARGHHSAVEDTLAALAASGGSSGAITYQKTTFTLAALQALGASPTGILSAAALPANARVMAAEIIVDVLLTAAAAFTGAYGFVQMLNAGARGRAAAATDPVLYDNGTVTAGWHYAADLGAESGNNIFASQGGKAPTMAVVLTGGANLSSLTAGQITILVYYAIIP